MRFTLRWCKGANLNMVWIHSWECEEKKSDVKNSNRPWVFGEVYTFTSLQFIILKSVDRAGRGDRVSGRAREVPSERHHGGGDAGGRGSGGQRPGQGRVSYSKT